MNPPTTERRKQERLGLRMPVRFSGVDPSAAVSCFTENISSDGFYCICSEPLVPGERREVHLLLPAHSYGRAEAGVDIKCQARVVRIDSLGSGPGFGVACQIEKYTLTWVETDK
jgi:hypothetical protein